jgi:hypothetical protein
MAAERSLASDEVRHDHSQIKNLSKRLLARSSTHGRKQVRLATKHSGTGPQLERHQLFSNATIVFTASPKSM